MRSDTEFIKKITELKGIKPREEWVVLTKKQILGWEPKFGINLIFRPVFASLAVVLIFGGIGVFAKDSVPGEFLYPIKRAGEKTIVFIMPEKSKPGVQLTIANDKLESIVKAAKANQSNKIIPIVREYQENISEAAETIKRTSNTDMKGIAQATKKIEENKEKIETTYGVLLGEDEDLNEALSQLLENNIKDWEKLSLSEEQLKQLEKIKTDYENKDYSEALEKFLLLSNGFEEE